MKAEAIALMFDESGMDLKSEPIISVLVPVADDAHYLLESVTSALKQSYPCIEVCIADNASEDGTASVIEELAAQDLRIQCHRSPRPLSPHANWLKALSLSSGEFVYFLGSDDYLVPDALSSLASMLKLDTSACAVLGRIAYFSDVNHRIIAELPPASLGTVLDGEAFPSFVHWMIANVNHDELILALWRREHLLWAMNRIRLPALESAAWWWQLGALLSARRSNQHLVLSDKLTLMKRYEHQHPRARYLGSQLPEDRSRPAWLTSALFRVKLRRNSIWNATRLAVAARTWLPVQVDLLFGRRRHSQGLRSFSLFCR